MIRSGVVEITPEQASAYLLECAYDKQRALSKDRVELYAEQMKSGAWLDGASSICFASLNDKFVLIDGQHRLHAIAASQTTHVFPIIVTEVSDTDSIANLYATIDRGRSRSLLDGFVAHDLSERIGVSNTSINHAGAALQVIARDFITTGGGHGRKIINSNVITKMIVEYGPAISAYVKETRDATHMINRALVRASVMAVGIATFRYAVDVYGHQPVADFWRQIALGDGLRIGDGRKVAADHLTSTSLSHGMANHTSGIRYVSSDYQARYVAGCWNAYVEKRDIRHVKVADTTAPIKIAGTPWNG